MASSTARAPAPADALALQVSAAARPGQPLFAFSLGGRATRRSDTGLGLVWLGGDFEREYWQVPALVERGGDQRDWWACGRDVMALAMARPDDGDDDPEALTFGLYRELIARVREAGFPEFLRIWNFLPGINRGRGDRERYRRFCLGRGRALSEAGLDDAAMCAATAIGSHDDCFRLFALAGRRPGRSFENPRQVSAWQYPQCYGPRSPAFARATAIDLAAGQVGVLVSGTASVVGHATVHPGDVLAQAAEAARNVDALLASVARELDRPSLARPGAASLVRVYMRQAADWPRVESLLRQHWPGVALAGLRGDICRRDLLAEIEAWHCTEPPAQAAVSQGKP